MHLYLMRHGIAEDPAPGRPDRARALTPRGRAKLGAGMTAARRLGWRADVLLSSPHVRAVQTASYVADAFGTAVLEDARLASGAALGAYLDVIAEQFDAANPPEHVWIVTHEPDLSLAIHALTGGAVAMRKGTIACLDVRRAAPGGARLDGLYDPDVLAALGTGPQ